MNVYPLARVRVDRWVADRLAGNNPAVPDCRDFGGARHPPLTATYARLALRDVRNALVRWAADPAPGEDELRRTAHAAELWGQIRAPKLGRRVDSTAGGASAPQLPRGWAKLPDGPREALTAVATRLARFGAGAGSGATYFPLWIERREAGELVQLTVHRFPARTAAVGPSYALAPWSGLRPTDWVPVRKALRNGCGAELLAAESGGPADYLFEFTPLREDTFPVVTFPGVSFGFAALLALASAGRDVQLAPAVSTGALAAAGPGEVAGLNSKARAVHNAGRDGLMPPRVPFFCPRHQTDASDRSLVRAEDLPLDVRGRIDLQPVASWDRFARDDLEPLFTDPFDEYRKQLRTHCDARLLFRLECYPGAADPLPVYVADFDSDPSAVARRAARPAAEAGINRPVPVLLDLARCPDPRADNRSDWISRGIGGTYYHHPLPVPPDAALRARVEGRSRLLLTVFSAKSSDLRWDAERAKIGAVLEYVSGPHRPHQLTVAFVGSDSSHAEMIRRAIASHVSRDRAN